MNKKEMENKISLDDWKEVTMVALDNVVELFNKKEIDVICDFIQTVTDKDLNKTESKIKN